MWQELVAFERLDDGQGAHARAASLSLPCDPRPEAGMTRRTAAMSPGTITRYGARVFDDKRADPYVTTGKSREATRCRVCGSEYREGRWWDACETRVG